MDDGYIQELLNWSNPYITDNNPFEYTEKENAEMLRLPRKECSIDLFMLFVDLNSFLLSQTCLRHSRRKTFTLLLLHFYLPTFTTRGQLNTIQLQRVHGRSVFWRLHLQPLTLHTQPTTKAAPTFSPTRNSSRPLSQVIDDPLRFLYTALGLCQKNVGRILP